MQGVEVDWELSKENFLPLKQGRAPLQLSVKPQPLQQSSQNIEEQRRQFWKAIAEYNGPDPLETWHRFIKWTQETFHTGGHQAELLSLLERCTRSLQSHERYKNDIRYLRIWIQYADCLAEPKDVFVFLKEHDIGQDFALFYIAYAAFLELRGSFARAEAVFQSGLDRMAHPVEKLRSKYEDFQHRMERRAIRRAQTGECDPEEATPSRTAFADLGAAVRASGHRPAAAAGSRGGLQRASKRARPSSAVPEKENAGGLDIFVDEEFRSGGAVQGGPDVGAKVVGSAWKHLGSFEQTRKENTQQPAVWAGNKFKQKKALMAAPAPALDIPEDPDLQERSPLQLHVPEGTLRQRLDRDGHGRRLEEDLQHEPLRLYKDIGVAGVSFSREPGTKRAKTPTMLVESKKALTTSAAAGEVGYGGDAAAEVAVPGEAIASTAVRQGDMTVNTRDAFSATNSMFQGSLPHDVSWRAPAPQAQTASARPGPEPTVTISTAAAFQAVNSMFGGSLPHEGPPLRRSTAAARPPSGRRRAQEFAVYEDTGILASPGAAADKTQVLYEDAAMPGSPAGNGQGLQVYEDTQFLAADAAEGSQEGGLGVYEDTQFMTGCIGATGPAQPVLQAAPDSDEASDRENRSPPKGGAPPPLPPRSAKEDLPVLQDIRPERAVALGVELDVDDSLEHDGVEQPLQRLRLAGSREQDDFEVYCDNC